MNRYVLGPISFGSLTPTVIWQVQNVRVNPGIERLVQGAQSVDTAFAAAIKQLPMLSFDSHAIAAMLGVVGFGGANVDRVDVYFRQMEHGGMVAAGAKHLKVTLYDTLSLLRRISANQWAEATSSYDVIGTYNGTNVPIAVTANQALPAYDAAKIEKFTVGPGALNSVDIDNIQSLEVDTGIREIADGQDGGLYARFAAIHERQPTIRATTFDASALSTVGVGGASKDNAIFFLRGLTQKGQPAADTSAAHVKIAAVDSHVVVTDMGDVTTIEARPVWDGTNDLLSFTTAQKIAEA